MTQPTTTYSMYTNMDVVVQATQLGLQTLAEQFSDGSISASVYDKRYITLKKRLDERFKELNRLFTSFMESRNTP